MTRGEARKAGLKRFFSGIPCIHGHRCERITATGNCVKCHNKRAGDRIKRLLRTSAQYQEWNRKQSVKSYWKNRDKVREKARIFYAENKDRLAKYSADYYRKNKDKWRTSKGRRKALKRGNMIGKITVADIDRIYQLQKGKCAYCRVLLGKNYHKDHITPLSKGGPHATFNIQLTCAHCNESKHTADPIDFARRLGRLC